MSMSHKAYAFDWYAFESDELHRLLLVALDSGDPPALAQYIDAHREKIKDPYDGRPIGEGWQAMLENRDVQEYGDFALTRFYDPTNDHGIGHPWLEIDAKLAEQDRAALLGFSLGPAGHEFDPGRQGSYFQTPQQAVESLWCAERIVYVDALQPYARLLRTCAADGLGVYVTF